MARARRPGEVQRVEASSMLTPAVMQVMISQLGAWRTSSAVDEAQEIIVDAWECDDARRRVAMAKRALKVSPLCAYAYTLLVQETAETPRQFRASRERLEPRR